MADEDYAPFSDDQIDSYILETSDAHEDDRFFDDTASEPEDTTEIDDSLNSDLVLTNNIHDVIIPVLSPVSKSCSRCEKLTDDKEGTLQCFKCKSYVHYVCSRLPGYMLYLLKTTEFFYVCEGCVDAPSDFSLYDEALLEDRIQTTKQINNVSYNTMEMMDGINTSLHCLANSVDSLRTSIPDKSEHMQKSVFQLENKIMSLEKLIEKQLSNWHDDHVATDKQTLNNAIVMEQTIQSQEHEIEMLEVVLTDKNSFIEKLIEENKELVRDAHSKEEDMTKITCDLTHHKSHSEKLKQVVYKLKHQIKTYQKQENEKVHERNRDRKIHELYEKLRDATEIIPRTHDEICRLQKSVNILQEHLQQARTNTHHIKLVNKDSDVNNSQNDGEDIVIVHDTTFQYIPNHLENLSIRKIHALTLDDAYRSITRLETKPNVVLLHTGSVDLANLTEHEMVERVVKICNYVRKKGVKFIFSGIPVRKDQKFDLKVQLFNAIVVSKLSFTEGVTICRNDETTKVFNDQPLHTINLIDN